MWSPFPSLAPQVAVARVSRCRLHLKTPCFFYKIVTAGRAKQVSLCQPPRTCLLRKTRPLYLQQVPGQRRIFTSATCKARVSCSNAGLKWVSKKMRRLGDQQRKACTHITKDCIGSGLNSQSGYKINYLFGFSEDKNQPLWVLVFGDNIANVLTTRFIG